MPLNDERAISMSSGEDQGSDGESWSVCCDSRTSNSDQECSRDSFTSGYSSKHGTPSSSPPKIILDEVMDSAKDLCNLSLAHDIIVNQDYRVEPPKLPQNSLERIVRDTLHKAYWDVLESELNGDPPEYEHAIKLLAEIREILLSFLNPGANRMRTQIEGVLDMDLINQQAANDALDIQGIASYIMNTMAKLCAPVRDEDVEKLRDNTGNLVSLFREIFRVLDLMRLDMINYTIDVVRPELQRHSVEYERAKFQRILDKTPSALNHTTAWLKSTIEELMTTMNPTDPSGGPGKGPHKLPGPFLVFDTALVRILLMDYKGPLPETLVMDEARILGLQWRLQQLQAVNEVLLIFYSAIGAAIQGQTTLTDRLKMMTCVLLDGMHRPDFKVEAALEGVSAQICCELNKSLIERKYPPLTPALQATLTGQVRSITQKSNPIRSLVEDRTRQYFMALISAPKPLTKLEDVPAGLTAIIPELASLGAKFISLVSFNKHVYGPFYSGILKKVMFSDGVPAPNLPLGPSQSPVPSE